MAEPTPDTNDDPQQEDDVIASLESQEPAPEPTRAVVVEESTGDDVSAKAEEEADEKVENGSVKEDEPAAEEVSEEQTQEESPQEEPEVSSQNPEPATNGEVRV